ncbi:type II toxin-antitoxin system Phd/YefM family antitoxin [Pendulispora brunnea]|uniref:Antitoxin n=1 Tax=Pendulispora brunnea TaxID=2905690 RepID=A0ABZ2KRH5_9BACT
MAANILSASQFKSQCLELLDTVERTGEDIVITKHGRPIARLAPLETRKKSLFGSFKGKSTGDIIGPILPEEDWTFDEDNIK